MLYSFTFVKSSNKINFVLHKKSYSPISHWNWLAINAILIVKTENISWSDFIDEIKSNTSINDRIQIVNFLFEIGSIDGSLADEELSFIHSLSKDLGIVEIEFLKLLDKFKMWNKTIRSKILNQVNNTLENEKLQYSVYLITHHKIKSKKDIECWLKNITQMLIRIWQLQKWFFTRSRCSESIKLMRFLCDELNLF